MVNQECMYVSTPTCEVCGKGALLYVDIKAYQNLKNGLPTTIPSDLMDQIETGIHPECYDDMYRDSFDEPPLTPEEEEELIDDETV